MMEIELIKRKMRQLKICYHNPACETVSTLVDELNNKDNEIDRLKQENEKLQQNQAKLIEALKPFANIGEALITLQGTPPTSFELVNTVFIKASQTMKEVCGE